MGRFPSAVVLALGFLGLVACDAESGSSPPFTSKDLRAKIQELYETARNAGEDVPSDAYEWAKSDIERIGDWEYLIVRLDGEADAPIVERLNELGSERWEVFWLERQGAAFRVFFKRPARSYLRLLPLSELGRLVPIGDSPSE